MRVKPSDVALAALVVMALFACSQPGRLTREIAAEVIRETMPETEPAYAEVPMAVRWSAASPLDEFDKRTLESLTRLERMGLVAIARSGDDVEGVVSATSTPAAARVLGTVPSARGPAFRGRVADKRLDGVGTFTPHPSDARAGRVEVLWRYTNPTVLHSAFAPVSDRPIDVPYATVLTMSWIDGAWRGRIVVRKTRPTSPAGSTS